MAVKSPEQLAAAHWEYVEGVIRAEWEAWSGLADTSGLDAHCRIIGHHFRTSFVHGFKHGVEARRQGLTNGTA